MKSLPLFLILLLFSGCYTQVNIVKPRDNSEYVKPRPRSYNQEYRSQEYDQNEGEYVDGEDIYQQGFEDGYDRGANAFVDWNVANRWSPYYNRFYWSDPYWSGAFYDSYLWDPYFGCYAGWGLSYYDFGFYRRNHFGGIYGWNSGWGRNYWGGNNNLVIVINGNNQENTNTRWSYGPRSFGNDIQSPIRVSGRNSGVAKTSGNSGKYKKGNITVPLRPSRGGSQNKYKPSSGGSSGGSSSSGSSSGGSKSGGSSGGSARPSRTGDNSAALINDFSNQKAITIPSGYGTGLSSRSSSSGIASSGSSNNVSSSSSNSSKPQTVKVTTRSSTTSTKSTSSSSSKSGNTKARSSRKKN